MTTVTVEDRVRITDCWSSSRGRCWWGPMREVSAWASAGRLPVSGWRCYWGRGDSWTCCTPTSSPASQSSCPAQPAGVLTRPVHSSDQNFPLQFSRSSQLEIVITKPAHFRTDEYTRGQLEVTCSCIRSFLTDATSESSRSGLAGEFDLESSGVSSDGGNLKICSLNIRHYRLWESVLHVHFTMNWRLDFRAAL